MKSLNINLLPVDKRKKEQATLVNWPLLGTILFVFVAILAFAFLYFATALEISAKKQDKQQLADEIAKLNSQLQEVSRLEAQKAELDRANEVLVALVKRKVSFSKVLTELSKATPPKVWVSSINIEKTGDIKLAGYALDNEQKQVAALLLNMQNNKIFSDIQLNFSKTAKIQQKDVIQFEIVAKLVYSEATVDIELPPSLAAAQASAAAQAKPKVPTPVITPKVVPKASAAVKPTVKPAASAAVKPVVKPAVKPTASATVKPGVKPTASTTVKPGVKPTASGAMKPASPAMVPVAVASPSVAPPPPPEKKDPFASIKNLFKGGNK